MLSPAFDIFSCFKDNSYAPNFLNLFKHPIRSLPEGKDMFLEKNMRVLREGGDIGM